jgi:DNA-binding MarR family transcriptional regulator
LAEDIGTDAVEDFDAVLETLDTARGGGEGLDEVTIALLVAANNGELLYDISRWGEDIRLASKATFSRSKNRLEDKGLIDTEKVPIDVGRPRLRLMLGHGGLQEADIETVTEKAQAMLE